MNPLIQPLPIRRILRLAALVGLLSLGTSLFSQTPATVSINAASVVRNVPAGLGGTCAATTFWTSTSPAYRDDLIKARLGLVRIAAYPVDSAGGVTSVEAMDTKVAQLINAGAVPLFIQGIESATNNPTFYNALLRLNGTPYPAGDTTPINQRVATNITYLVNRYKSAPFNLTTQYWEIGNEPDLPQVNYAVATTQEYIDFFSLAHNQLVASGVRGNVLLAGPVTSYDYGFGNGNDGYKIRDDIMNDFLAACKNQVDIVTRHVYGLINPAWEVPDTDYNQLNSSVEMIHFDHTIGNTRGEKALLAKMNSVGVPASVGTGITELNMFAHNHTMVQGLWFLLAGHYTLYNPRSLVTNGFIFDAVNDPFAYYNPDRTRGFPYWAAYIHGALTGDQVLAQSSSDSHVVATATKDANYLYVRLVNRHDTTSFNTTVTISNPPPVSSPTLFNFTSTVTPETGSPVAYGTTFTRALAPMTACVIRYPRTDAPTPPTPPPPPTTVHFDTSFDTVPTGMQTYAVGFTPVVASGRLQLTNTTANSRGAVVFNGQSLAAATSRVQARFGFKVMHPYAEGFVFGAYSASPAAVGNAGQALGYQGQANRLWGVKIDNNPDEIGIVSGNANSTVDGWVSKPIPAYSGLDMYAVIDYDGPAGTVRARLYQGTSDTGTLQADIVNKVGNPASLAAGTVFGFAGSCGSYSQTTYIESLRILIGDAASGAEIILDSSDTVAAGVVRSSGWTSSSAVGGALNGSYYHDGNAGKGSRTVTYTPTFPSAGWRDVYVKWHAANTLRASNTLFTVNNSSGSSPTTKDQRVDGTNWIKLGTWYFNAGTGGNVVISNAGTTNYVIADGVRFVDVTP
jgi:hypothetical protein